MGKGGNLQNNTYMLMSKEEDQIVDREEAILALRIEKASNKPLDTSNPSGECWYCEEYTGISKRFCDTGCRDDYEKEGREWLHT